jgi:DNA-binding NtrC family response regulator
MTCLLAGDALIDETDPLRILWIDRREKGRVALAALAAEGTFFKVQECHSLAEGIKVCGRDRYDVVVLATDLPDAWPLDVFMRWAQEGGQDSPVVLVVEGPSVESSLRKAERHPFCVVGRARADPIKMRRLVISAGIFVRALSGPRQAPQDGGN